MDSSESPKGWVSTTLERVADWGSGGTPSRKNSEYFTGSIPWIKTGELVSKYIRDSEEKITEEAIKKSSAKIFPAGSIGIAMYGATIGKLSIFAIDASTNQACAVAKPIEGILYNEFLYYYLLSERKALIDSGKGGAQPNISQGLLKNWPILLPPLREQYSIIAKVEELFSELDSGIASLKTAREQLKIYRQALLKHAFEGKLTAQWRKDNADKLETPEQLLARIQTERETRYQQQLDEWKQAVKDWEVKGKKGKKPQNPIKPKTHKKLSSDEVIQLGGLPHDWCWIRIGDISTVGTGVTPLRSNSLFYGNGDIPWVTSGALNQAFITKPSDLVTTKAFNETSLRFYPKNTLVVALYGEGKTRGKCSELFIEATTNQAIAAIVLEGKSAGLRRFLKWFLTKNYEEMRLTASGGVQPNLNLGIIERMAIPLCTIAEAEELSSILDEKFSQIDKVDAEITEQLRKTEVLRQSILKKAFSGQLVPQDPNDEPASELHGRVKAGK